METCVLNRSHSRAAAEVSAAMPPFAVAVKVPSNEPVPRFRATVTLENVATSLPPPSATPPPLPAALLLLIVELVTFSEPWLRMAPPLPLAAFSKNVDFVITAPALLLRFRAPPSPPAPFPLNGVIKGWTEGVQLMVTGETRRFWIPEPLAYGGRRAPYGMLVFDVELISIKGK